MCLFCVINRMNRGLKLNWILHDSLSIPRVKSEKAPGIKRSARAKIMCDINKNMYLYLLANCIHSPLPLYVLNTTINLLSCHCEWYWMRKSEAKFHISSSNSSSAGFWAWTWMANTTSRAADSTPIEPPSTAAQTTVPRLHRRVKITSLAPNRFESQIANYKCMVRACPLDSSRKQASTINILMPHIEKINRVFQTTPHLINIQLGLMRFLFNNAAINVVVTWLVTKARDFCGDTLCFTKLTRTTGI